MAETDVEARLERKITLLQAQVNNLGAQLKRVHGLITSPSVFQKKWNSFTASAGLGDLLGTTNQIVVTDGTGAIYKVGGTTLSLPQNIHTGAIPTFIGFVLAAAATPGGAPANVGQVWTEDINGAAGYTGLHKMTETTATKEIVPGVILKTNTGSPSNPYEGLIEINTFDNKVRMYADAGWRQLATW